MFAGVFVAEEVVGLGDEELGDNHECCTDTDGSVFDYVLTIAMFHC